jgi:hypothetical protein
MALSISGTGNNAVPDELIVRLPKGKPPKKPPVSKGK